MKSATRKISLVFGVFITILAVISFIGAVPAAAQSDSGSFQITSSKDISAIQGESFTYFVVTANNTDYQLQSQLPSGLSFENGSITGTPQSTGDYQLDFVATDGSGTQTVNLTVLSSGGGGGSEVAQTGTGSGSEGSTANAGSQQDVSLNEIPDTGLSADQTITLTFYLLALLLLSVFAVTRFTNRQPAGQPDSENGSSPDDRGSSRLERNQQSVGDGVIS